MERDITNDTLGVNIKRLRKEKGMTQDEVAKAVYTTRYNILRYESGKMTPSSEVIERLEKALGVPTGSLAQKVAIAIPDTSALLRNKRLINLLLESYSCVIIPDIVSLELSGFKGMRTTQSSSAQNKRNKKIASQVMSMIEEYEVKYKGRVLRKSTKHYNVGGNMGISEKDQRIVELAKDVRKQTSRIVDIIHVDKDYAHLVDETVNAVYLEEYMARRSKLDGNYQLVLDFDKVFDHLERYDVAAQKMDLDAYLPDGMTLLISCIRCNEPEKVEERGGRIIPEFLIQKKMVFLLEHGASRDKTDSHQYCHTPLEHCMERYNPDFKEFCILLAYGADYNKCSVDETQIRDKRVSEINEGNTPLMIACYHGKEKYVKKLCSLPGICINSQDCNGFTPLIKCAAARWERKRQGKPYDRFEKIYRFLIDEMHADTLIRDRNNRTAQDWWDRPIEAEDGDD
ncbi:MAG: helix-turn-helix domain-containing protein [Lawsonibacter sp.]|nr:helix-turn-helix domain-containing protein [Lawsonibacter sp.]